MAIEEPPSSSSLRLHEFLKGDIFEKYLPIKIGMQGRECSLVSTTTEQLRLLVLVRALTVATSQKSSLSKAVNELLVYLRRILTSLTNGDMNPYFFRAFLWHFPSIDPYTLPKIFSHELNTSDSKALDIIFQIFSLKVDSYFNQEPDHEDIGQAVPKMISRFVVGRAYLIL